MSLIVAFGCSQRRKSFDKAKQPEKAYSKFISGIKEVISDRRVVITCMHGGITKHDCWSLGAFLPIYAVTVAGSTNSRQGFSGAILGVFTILSKPVMGKTSDRYGRKPLITMGLILMRLIVPAPSPF